MSDSEKTLLRSQVRCRECKELIASFSVHDYKRCKCGHSMIDGGLDYLRTGGDPEFCSILVKGPLSLEAQKRILGTLCAMDYGRFMDVDEVFQAMVAQERAKPWFPAPSVQSDVSRVLRLLADEELVVAGPTLPSGLVTVWIRTVQLAPWPNDLH